VSLFRQSTYTWYPLRTFYSLYHHTTTTYLSHRLAELLTAGDCSSDSLIDHLLEASGFEALDGRVSSTVRAGDVATKLFRLIRRRHEHLSCSKAGLRRKTSGLLDWEALRNSAGNEVLDHHEKVGWAGSCEVVYVSFFSFSVEAARSQNDLT
jgi:hypothetical protein